MPPLLLLLLGLVHSAGANFSEDFSSWLARNYGEEIRDQLERRDIGFGGSFGGRSSPLQPLSNQPVIFVHGVSDTAGQKPRDAANFFKSQGYTDAEVYSTTYFNGAQGNPLKWVEYSMKCEYVKQVRALIVAVRFYTGRAVDLVSFSLGVPITRKAVMGGRCVDTGEDLGGPLTRIVDSFVGVAGPNHGISPQVGGVVVPGCAFSVIPICNEVTGLYSGVCPRESSFLQDINSQSHYEGLHVYSIYTTTDQIIGLHVCNRITTQVPGHDGEKVFNNGWNHDQAFHNSHDVQLRMVRDHVIP